MSLVGNQSNMVPANTPKKSTLEARLEARLEAALEDIGQGYNSVEERVHILETASPSFLKRLDNLEDAIRPYAQYKEQCKTAVAQLNGIKSRVEALNALKTSDLSDMEKKFDDLASGITKKMQENQPQITNIEERLRELAADLSAKTNYFTQRLNEGSSTDLSKISDIVENLVDENTAKIDALTKRLDAMPEVDVNQADVNANVENLLARVSKLESHTQPAQADALSVDDLALSLVSRLEQGEIINATTIIRLRAALEAVSNDDGSPEASQQPQRAEYHTPDSAVPTSEQAAVEKAPVTLSPRKRTREQANTGEDVSPPDLSARPKKRLRSTSHAERQSIRKSPRKSARQVVEETRAAMTAEPDADDENDGDSDDAEPEIRRSTRAPKPTMKKYGSYLTWKEVKERRKTVA